MKTITFFTNNPYKIVSEQAAEALERYKLAVGDVFYDRGRGALTHDQAIARIDEISRAYEEEQAAIYAQVGIYSGLPHKF